METDLGTVVNPEQARRPTATDVIDVIDRVLDKGIVIECRVNRVSLGGIDLPVTMDAFCVVASLETYLEYAEPLRKTGLLGGTDTWLRDLTIP